MKYKILPLLLLLLASCRSDDVVFRPEVENPGEAAPTGELVGFYLLNEGNMGTNKSTLDFYDMATGTYMRNIYGAANPDVPKELGDVGNDLQIYGSRMYAVINCSNKVEVMDAATARRIGTIEIPNCRAVAFDGPKAYVTSYAGPVEINPDYRQRGYVARVDTATLQVEATCLVGFQPDRLCIVGDRIYVANSGGYMVPNYENTVSVIDLRSFTTVETVEIAINLDCCVADRRGRVWVSSRGDYYDIPPRLYCYDPAERRVIATFDVAVGSCWLDGDMLYVTGVATSNITGDAKPSYSVIDTATLTVAGDCYINEADAAAIRKPYGVAVNPANGDIYVTDAGNYVNPGYLYCFTAEGERLWRVRTGDIPAHFAFLYSTIE